MEEKYLYEDLTEKIIGNPILVRFMENLGYVDKLGRGLPMVCSAAKKLGTNVEFQESGDEFRVTLPLKH
jgi:ATP-dependent DNA helicase RecG